MDLPEIKNKVDLTYLGDQAKNADIQFNEIVRDLRICSNADSEVKF